MAYDAALATLCVCEMNERARGAKVEKIYQPSKDEIILQCRKSGQGVKILVSVNPASARVCISGMDKDNPKTPPMFCMLLRKHLTGTVIQDIYTCGFERVVEIKFSAFDELGFPCEKYLTSEIMGKSSNVFLLGGEGEKKRILGMLHIGDFTMGARHIVAGALYELPPRQDKKDPTVECEEGFYSSLQAYPRERGVDKFIVDTYLGISPLAARECAFLSGGAVSVEKCSPRMVWRAFSDMMARVNEKRAEACVVEIDGRPVEYSFFPIRQYGEAANVRTFESFAAALDYFFGERERAESMNAKAHDVKAIVSSAKKKLEKKLPALEEELMECDEAEKFKLWGDLITSSLYMLHGKSEFCDVTNYYSETLEKVRVPLDSKLSAGQNAAKYYKKYNKLKTAKQMLSSQITKARAELDYLYSVEAALTLCESEGDISEIRIELAEAGYSPKTVMINRARAKAKFEPKHYITSGGYELYVGKNNIQNDYVTTRLAKKSDWWFHVKGGAGSHVVMVCPPDEEPDARDFTEAAQTAAYFSSLRDGENVAVDYTRIRNVKKPSGSVAGYVIYTSNYTAYVEPKCDAREYNTKV